MLSCPAETCSKALQILAETPRALSAACKYPAAHLDGAACATVSFETNTMTTGLASSAAQRCSVSSGNAAAPAVTFALLAMNLLRLSPFPLLWLLLLMWMTNLMWVGSEVREFVRWSQNFDP
jgi:hypothetical protein